MGIVVSDTRMGNIMGNIKSALTGPILLNFTMALGA